MEVSCGIENENEKMAYIKTKLLNSSKPALFYAALNVENKERVTLVRNLKTKDLNKAFEEDVAEMAVLKKVDHKNVLKFIDHVPGKKEHHQYLVFEPFTYFLADLIQYSRINSLEANVAKNIFKQLLTGLDYLHSHSIIHRDLHPQTILLGIHGILKISCFQNALVGGQENRKIRTAQFGYQAPELLLELQICTSAVDLWSAACIFAELIMGRPLFSDDPNLVSAVLNKILFLLGSPSRELWPDLYALQSERIFFHEYRNSHSISFLKEYIHQGKSLPEYCEEIIGNVLLFDPKRRFTANMCLADSFLSEDSTITASSEEALGQLL